eukprot:tig00021254_g19696.t1
MRAQDQHWGLRGSPLDGLFDATAGPAPTPPPSSPSLVPSPAPRTAGRRSSADRGAPAACTFASVGFVLFVRVERPAGAAVAPAPASPTPSAGEGALLSSFSSSPPDPPSISSLRPRPVSFNGSGSKRPYA